MNVFQKELQKLKSWDEIKTMEFNPRDKGLAFITTAGHGYLVIPKLDYNYELAKTFCDYGFIGTEAVYLEEDLEAGAFLNTI